MSFTVQIERIQFHHDGKRGEDGSVLYLILSPCPDEPCNHVCESHPRMVHHYARQAFRRGEFGHRTDATPEEIASHRANVWGWDGNTEAPTLNPSFLVEHGVPYRMHSFLRAGRLELCGDSTVALHPSPVPCRDPFDQAAA
jgi:hypothetical protein